MYIHRPGRCLRWAWGAWERYRVTACYIFGKIQKGSCAYCVRACMHEFNLIDRAELMSLYRGQLIIYIYTI